MVIVAEAVCKGQRLLVVAQFEIHSLAIPPDLWETVGMAKREMRVVKYIGPAPFLAISTYCRHQFKVPPDVTITAADAAVILQAEFDKHKCERMDESQTLP